MLDILCINIKHVTRKMHRKKLVPKMKGQQLKEKDSSFLKNFSEFQTKLLFIFDKKGKYNRG